MLESITASIRWIVNLVLNDKLEEGMMQNNRGCRFISVLLIFLMMVIAGCATTRLAKPSETIAPPPQEIAASSGWWSARFQMHWPQEAPANWHLDLLIAHKIVLPALTEHQDEILLWRFHRRAVRDEAGHQFSFIFYAPAETAYQVYHLIRSNELLSEMKFAGMIVEDGYDNTDRISKPGIEEASDAAWPHSIQKNWPYFIMGASQMWLNLISETIAGMPNSYRPQSIEEYEARYEEANAVITELWRKKGQHAFLHHLSALFGYQEIIFYDRRMLKF